MFEKRTRLRVKSFLEKQFNNIRNLEQTLKDNLIDKRVNKRSTSKKVSVNRSTNERNMTRKSRTRRARIHSYFQSGYCAVCHVPYISLTDHLQSKRHLKLIGDDGFISIKGLDSFLALEGIEGDDVNAKNGDDSPPRRRKRMPRTRTASLMCDRIKDSPMSPVGSDSGHHLRSRKNINYMTPPLEEDSLTEKPEVVKEYRELRSSSRLLAKLADQMVENDEVWNSGRPKRSCNRPRISADERLVVDNKSYYKVEVLSSKLRSGQVTHYREAKRPETPISENKEDFLVKIKKVRNSELVRLNNEAENFLFPKKDDTSDEEDDDDDTERSQRDTSSVSDHDEIKRIKMEDDESMHSTSSESKGKKKRRTHAEAFIMDNQKYYKFETPGSRLRYQGSYLSPVPMKAKNNGDCLVKHEPDESSKGFKLSLEDYNFSFESVPRHEAWYQTFQRRDQGEEKYVFLNDDNYWSPFILPYQLDYVPPLDPQECLSQYNQIKKCLMEPPSASTSVTCSTPDPNASNSSVETPFNQDEDSKISATEISSNSSTIDDIRPSRTSNKRQSQRSRSSGAIANVTGNGKNPRKSPRQHASTLAILSSLIQQRKRKSRRGGDLDFRTSLPTILEEGRHSKVKKPKVDYVSLMKNVEEEFASVCDENFEMEVEEGEEIELKGNVGIEDILNMYESQDEGIKATAKRLLGGRPGRKPGKRKKNQTGWPRSRSRRSRRDHAAKEDDDSTVDSASVNADSEENEDTNSTDSIKKKESVVEKVTSENNNQNEQNSLGDVNIADTNCDLNNDDRVGKKDDNTNSGESDKVLTNKVNNSDGFSIDLQFQPYVRVQKLDRIDNKNETAKRSSSPKRTNRGQRRMPASPKSPRMLRRPRGRWYRER